MADPRPARITCYERMCAGTSQISPPGWSIDQVTSEQAIKKYRGQLAELGVPDWHTATTGTPSPFLYPMFLAIARQKSGSERVVAIDAYRNRVDADLGVELSKQIAWVKESLGR